jgi:enediyne biosynthesis protein E5
VLRLFQVIYAPFYALFIVGPAALLLEMWLDSRRMNTAKANA